LAKKRRSSKQKLLGVGIVAVIVLSVIVMFNNGTDDENGFYSSEQIFTSLFDLRLVGGQNPHTGSTTTNPDGTVTSSTTVNGCTVYVEEEKIDATTYVVKTITDCGFTIHTTSEEVTVEPEFSTKISSLIYWIHPDTYNAQCNLKMTTNAQFTDSSSRAIQSQFDYLRGLELFDRSQTTSSDKEITKYLNDIKIFCEHVKDRDGNILAMKVTPNSDMKVKTYAYGNNNGNEILIKTSSLISPSSTTINTNNQGFGEFTIGKSEIRADEIENKLPSATTEYPSSTRHVLEGSLTIEVPWLSQKYADDGLGKHSANHNVYPNGVKNVHLIKVQKIEGSPIGLGGGQNVQITSYNPKIIDSRSATIDSRTVSVNVSLDDWVQAEGNPFIKIIRKAPAVCGNEFIGFFPCLDSSDTLITKIQMQRIGSNGVDTEFFATYNVPLRAEAGTLEIKAESNAVLGGILARPNTPVVTFEVINAGVETQQCADGSVIPKTQTCPVQMQTCSDGSVIPATSTCPTGGGGMQQCADGSVIPITSVCPTSGGGNGEQFDLTEFLNSLGLGGNNILYVIGGLLFFVLLIVIITSSVRPRFSASATGGV